MSRDIHMPLAIDEIVIPDGRREVNADVVKRLADSIENVGLRHPVTVRKHRDEYVLVAGRHRIEACRRLGREHVPAIICSLTNAEARMWEIAENLHRAELSKLERSEQIAEWVRLCDEQRKPAQVAPVSGGRGNESGINAASRELGIERTEAQRSIKIASITPEAKRAAEQSGIDDNQSKLLEIAREAPERQVAKVTELATRKPVKIADAPLNDFETKEKWMAAGMSWWNRGSKEWREEFLSRVDKPVMDHRYAGAAS